MPKRLGYRSVSQPPPISPKMEEEDHVYSRDQSPGSPQLRIPGSSQLRVPPQRLQRSFENLSSFREEEAVAATPSSTATGTADRSSRAEKEKAEKVVITVNGNPYTVLKQIGKGGSSVVYQALDGESGDLKAIKRVDLSRAEESEAEGYLNEVR